MSFFHDTYVHEDQGKQYPGHIFRFRPPTLIAVAFDRRSFRLYLFGKRVITWYPRFSR